jgi:hypothetical protein
MMRIGLAKFRSEMHEAGAEDAVNDILAILVRNIPERMAEVAGAVRAGDALGGEVEAVVRYLDEQRDRAYQG